MCLFFKYLSALAATAIGNNMVEWRDRERTEICMVKLMQLAHFGVKTDFLLMSVGALVVFSALRQS